MKEEENYRAEDWDWKKKTGAASAEDGSGKEEKSWQSWRPYSSTQKNNDWYQWGGWDWRGSGQWSKKNQNGYKRKAIQEPEPDDDGFETVQCEPGM